MSLWYVCGVMHVSLSHMHTYVPSMLKCSLILLLLSPLDIAWLWPYSESIRKCGRSWSSVVALMEEYPQFTFACSQVSCTGISTGEIKTALVYVTSCGECETQQSLYLAYMHDSSAKADLHATGSPRTCCMCFQST